jgi:hypothetical protein
MGQIALLKAHLLSGCVIVYTGLLVVETVRMVDELRDEMKALQIDLD